MPRLTFFVTLVPDGDGVVAQRDALGAEHVRSHAGELRRGNQSALVGEHVHAGAVHQQKVPGRTRAGLNATVGQTRKEPEGRRADGLTGEVDIIKAATYLVSSDSPRLENDTSNLFIGPVAECRGHSIGVSYKSYSMLI